LEFYIKENLILLILEQHKGRKEGMSEGRKRKEGREGGSQGVR